MIEINICPTKLKNTALIPKRIIGKVNKETTIGERRNVKYERSFSDSSGSFEIM